MDRGPESHGNPQSPRKGPLYVVYTGITEAAVKRHAERLHGKAVILPDGRATLEWLEQLKLDPEGQLPDAILCRYQLDDMAALDLYARIQEDPSWRLLPFIILAKNFKPEDQESARAVGVDDFFPYMADPAEIEQRIRFLQRYKAQLIRAEEEDLPVDPWVLPWQKRLFDITASSVALILLLPLMLLVALLIALESRGPIFYISNRVGRGFKIFPFYKFRTMIEHAEAQLPYLMHLNLYKGTDLDVWSKPAHCFTCVLEKKACSSPITLQGREVCAKQFAIRRKPPVFVKLDNDPRVTRIGRILRKTSLDELPQLLNVLLGDMSIVGNRPLPLYEAEQLTADQWAQRFMAPAGITGLWQVKSRGNKPVSELKRKRLDVEYAARASFKQDLRLIIQTIPALLDRKNT